MSAILAVLLLSLTSSSAPVRARDVAPRITTVVFDFRASDDVDPGLAVAFAEAFATALDDDDRRLVFWGQSLHASLRVNNKAELVGCNDAPCLLQTASLFEADTLVIGTLTRRGAELVVEVSEIDAVTLHPIVRAEGASLLDGPERTTLVRRLVDELALARPRVPLYGTLDIKSVPLGLPIVVDGREFGATPLRKPIAIGVHGVVIGDGAGGQVAFDIDVQHKRSTAVDVKLREVAPPPTPEERAYQTDVVFGPYYYVAKLIVGTLMVGVFGALSLYTGFVTTPFLFYVNEIDLRRPEVWFLLGWGGVSLLSAVAAVVGLGLIAWGVVDIIDAPVEPRKAPMWHRVFVRGPDGEHTFTYPVEDVPSPPLRPR